VKEPRTLRGRAERGALYYSQDGRCAQCGDPLGAGWHADHVIPWRLRQVTNVHEMQPLCRRCNLQKGGKE
jgi:5-methylcytosine-specific restriction endonuclease McrA